MRDVHPDPSWLGRRLIVRPVGDGLPVEGALGSERAQAAIADDGGGCWPMGAASFSPMDQSRIHHEEGLS